MPIGVSMPSLCNVPVPIIVNPGPAALRPCTPLDSRSSSPVFLPVVASPISHWSQAQPAPDSGLASGSFPTHKRFYFEDGTVIFRVESILFKVHRHFFLQYSRSFAAKYLPAHSNGNLKSAAGASETLPIVLEDISVLDFERFLSVFYPKSFDSCELTETEHLVPVLRLARKWEFPSIVGLVARRLTEVASPVEQIALALEHDLPDIVGPAGAKLCARGEPLTLAESRRLGVDAAYAIWTLRERFRGAQQAVLLSDVAHEEKRVTSFFEEAGLLRRGVDNLSYGRPERSSQDPRLYGPMTRSPSPCYVPHPYG